MNRNKQFNGRSMMRIRSFSKTNDNELLEKLNKKWNDRDKDQWWWEEAFRFSQVRERVYTGYSKNDSSMSGDIVT